MSNCDGMNRITLIIIFVKPCSRDAYHFLPARSLMLEDGALSLVKSVNVVMILLSTFVFTGLMA